MKSNLAPRFKGMLSLARKAGKLETGEARATDAIRGDKTFLIILSEDASANTGKKFSNMAAFRDIPILKMGDRYELGAAIGTKFAVVIAVTDSGFATSLMEIVKKTEQN